jgi:penicillin-binding protein 2A
MKKGLKIAFYITTIFIILILLLYLTYIILTQSAKLNDNKLINLDVKINYYDNTGSLFLEESNGKEVAEFNEIPKTTLGAFISIEDRRFYKHNGVDYKSLTRAFFNNIKSFMFKEGASTITQQLVKNTHLSSDKTIARKLKEIRLAKKLEKKYSKEQILEKYLNTIYFGDGCYGIKHATKHYFSKNPEELTINESAILASIIKAPSIYSPTKNLTKNLERKNVVLRKMHEEGYISKEELNENLIKNVELNLSVNNKYNYKSLVKEEVEKIIESNPYASKTLNVYTYCDAKLQEEFDKLLQSDDINAEKSIVLLDNYNNVIAYSSTVNNPKRQVGSTIKPLAVYAPALEMGTHYLCSMIEDKKININGYSPSNFNNKYYGYVSFKESLAKSLNSPAVQILNTIGVENSINYLSKLDFNLTKNDENLSLALGSTENGQNLTTLTSSYSCFRNGDYITPSIIEKIQTENGEIIYKNNKNTKSVFRNDTANLIKTALKDTVKNGTAKKLSFLPFELCSKTGTVGNEKGNTDAYNVSFNDNFTLGIWYGNKDGELMSNEILGGTYPTTLAKSIWEVLNTKSNLNEKITIENLNKFEIDKLTLENENVIILADDNAPPLLKQTELFGKHAPKQKSTIFSTPIPASYNYSVNNNIFSLSLCQTKYCFYEIYVEENGVKKLLYTSSKKEPIEYTYNLLENTEYSFSIVPCYKNKDNKIFKGNEIVITKIKTPSNKTDGDWWNDEI